jgi:hypothetical protein
VLTIQPTCFSGGANGSDLAWGFEAKWRGFKIVHFSFEGHQSYSDPNERVVLTDEQLAAADEALLRANTVLMRKNPLANEQPRKRLLQRNWFQIRDTQAVYAVAKSIDKAGNVAGGTGWAVQMFRDRVSRELAHALLPMYVFEQTRRRWFQATTHELWVECAPPPPTAYDYFTGIGTRTLNQDGHRAINEVWGS